MANNSIKILVIDDLQDNLTTLNALIKDALPEAITLNAQSGEKGLDLAAKENPDVILLDILMPVMDGYEVCKKLKADKELCDIPVVFVTAMENTKAALVKALDSGGEAFLTKPIDEIELTAQIRSMLKIREANNAKKDEKVRLEKLVEERSKELVQELDARKQAQEKLLESESKFRLMTENSIDIIWQMDLKLSFTYTSPSVELMFGFTQEEWTGSNLASHATRRQFFKMARVALNGIKTYKTFKHIRFEAEMLHKDGSSIPVEIMGRLIKNEKGIPIGLQGSTRDITERKQAEEQLKESEEKFKTIVENGSVLLTLTDSLGRIEFASPQCERVIGWKEEDIMGVNLPDFIHPDDKLRVAAERKKVTSKQSIKDLEYRIIDKENKIRWISHSAAIIKKGDAFSILSTITNITERKQTEVALMESEEKHRLYFEHAPLSYQSLNEEGFILNVNQTWLKLLAYDREEVIGKWFGDFLHPGQKEVFRKLFPENIKRKDIIRDVIFLLKNKNGNYISAEYTAKIGFDEQGNFVQTHCLFQDITERKQAEENLRESEERFNLAMNASNDGLFDWNLLSNEIYYSPAWKKMIGYEDHELPNDFSVWEKTTEPEDVKKSWELQQKLISKQIDRFVIEFKMKHKNGHWVDILSQARAIFDDKGKAIRMVGTHTDITERKQVEEKLKESETRMRNLFNAMHDIVFEMDYNGTYLNIAPTSPELMVKPAEEMTGKTLHDAFPKQQADIFLQFIKNCIDKNKPDKITYPIEFESKTIWFEGRANPVGNKRLLFIASDISERKRAEKKLFESKKLLSTIAENFPNSYLSVINSDFTIGLTSGQELKKQNIDPKQLEGLKIDQIFGDKTEFILEKYKKTFRGEEQTFEIFFNDQHQLYKVVPLFADDGSVPQILSVVENITDRKQAEEALRKSEALQSKMAANIGDVIVIIDDKGLNRYKSPNTEKLFGWKPEELIGQSTWDNVHPDDLEHGKSFIGSLLEEPNKTGTTELRYKRKDGSYSYILFTGVNLLHDADIKGILGNYHDITESKKAEKELIEAKEKAEESNRLKTAFLNNMSHEIRTPLNGITGFIGLLQDSEIDDKDKHNYFDIINKSSDRLITTVTDIINISRIEAGLVKVSKTVVSVNEILEEQYRFFYHQAKSKELELVYKPGLSESEARLVTDKHKLEGILTNLIKNAIKFTEQGEIRFACSLKKEQETDVLEFYVKDTGIGIPVNRIDAIFNRFEQADIEDSRAFEGSGLGLAIAKSYVEMLGGKISVNSKEGEGTTFTFSLPYTKQLVKQSDGKGNINKETQTAFSNLSVIIAEDDETSIMFFDAIFKNEFKNINYTKTGKETIDKCRENPETDLILMDIKMPGMNGYDATREIRKFNSNVVIIAQTAFGLTGDRNKAIEAGCNDYIAKPIKKEELKMIIKKHFKNYKKLSTN